MIIRVPSNEIINHSLACINHNNDDDTRKSYCDHVCEAHTTSL